MSSVRFCTPLSGGDVRTISQWRLWVSELWRHVISYVATDVSADILVQDTILAFLPWKCNSSETLATTYKTNGIIKQTIAIFVFASVQISELIYIYNGFDQRVARQELCKNSPLLGYATNRGGCVFRARGDVTTLDRDHMTCVYSWSMAVPRLYKWAEFLSWRVVAAEAREQSELELGVQKSTGGRPVRI
jgi:hypothetical protein